MLQGIVQEEKEAIATVVVVTRAVLDGVKVKRWGPALSLGHRQTADCGDDRGMHAGD